MLTAVTKQQVQSRGQWRVLHLLFHIFEAQWSLFQVQRMCLWCGTDLLMWVPTLQHSWQRLGLFFFFFLAPVRQVCWFNCNNRARYTGRLSDGLSWTVNCKLTEALQTSNRLFKFANFCQVTAQYAKHLARHAVEILGAHNEALLRSDRKKGEWVMSWRTECWSAWQEEERLVLPVCW